MLVKHFLNQTGGYTHFYLAVTRELSWELSRKEVLAPSQFGVVSGAA